jgi:hypothetical protein
MQDIQLVNCGGELASIWKSRKDGCRRYIMTKKKTKGNPRIDAALLELAQD